MHDSKMRLLARLVVRVVGIVNGGHGLLVARLRLLITLLVWLRITLLTLLGIALLTLLGVLLLALLRIALLTLLGVLLLIRLLHGRCGGLVAVLRLLSVFDFASVLELPHALAHAFEQLGNALGTKQ